VKEGAYYGWPWYYMGDHEDPRLKGERPDLAGKTTIPDVPYTSHSAALNLLFYTATSGRSAFPKEYRGDGFAVLHGSWNRALRDADVFARATVGEGGQSVVWPEDVDIGAARLLELGLKQAGRGDAAEFIRWRWRNGLSLTAAAEALGLSRRQIAYYASGEHEVPRYVQLACRGWEAERHAANNHGQRVEGHKTKTIELTLGLGPS
jgi:hypothetical protein